MHRGRPIWLALLLDREAANRNTRRFQIRLDGPQALNICPISLCGMRALHNLERPRSLFERAPNPNHIMSA
jgi:hypothetical protein